MLLKGYKDHSKKTLVLAYPIILSNIGHIMVGIVDSIMVGQIGATELAAAALANSIFALALMFGIGISYGITPLVASAEGRGDKKDSAGIYKHGLMLCMLTGILLFLLMYMLSPLLGLLDQPEDVVVLAIPYFNILVLSMVPLMVFQGVKQYFDGLSLTKPAMYVTLVSNALNVALNYILIYGKLGFEPMGLNGAGWASLISRVFLAVAMLIVFYRSGVYREIKAFALKFSSQLFKKLVRIGFPIGSQIVFEMSTFTLAAIMVGWLGANELAAHQIALSVSALTYMMASGISSAATIRIGNFYGSGDAKNLQMAGYSTFIMTGVFMLVCAILFLVGRFYLPQLYVNEIEVIQIASMLMIIAALFQLSDGIQVAGLGVLRGMTDVKIPTYITIFAYWVIGLPAGYVLGFIVGWGVMGVWIGLFLGLSVAAFFLFIRFQMLSNSQIKLQLNAQ